MLKKLLEDIENGQKPTITQKEVDLLVKNEPSVEQIEIGCKEYHVYCIWGSPIWVYVSLNNTCYTYNSSKCSKGSDWVCPSQDTKYYLM